MVEPMKSDLDHLITCFAINLDRRTDRWRRTKLLCRLHRLSVNRFSAHDGVKGAAHYPNSRQFPSELGLLSSFAAVVRTPVDTPWILVLEDDVMPLPRFRRHVLREIRRAGPDVVAIRLGWLGRSAWRPHRSILANLKRSLRLAFRAVVRRVAALVGIHRPETKHAPWGTHCVLVRADGVERMLSVLEPTDLPLDAAFMYAESIDGSAFVCSERNGAWQWPSVSDIETERGAAHPRGRLTCQPAASPTSP